MSIPKEQLERDMVIFRKRYQHIVDKMIEYESYGEDEILITMSDGTELVYNVFMDKLRRVNKQFNDNRDVNEDSWREMFSIRLCGKMRLRAMSRWKLSELTGISEVTISKYMNGKATPSAYNLRKIAIVLECPISELMNIM